MRNDASGVALLARLLSHLADTSGVTVSDLALALDTPRSTSFDLIRQLEAAGFAERDAAGLVSVGVEASRLGFASVGLARLLGPAEALVAALRDDTDATASLLVRQGGEDQVLLQRRAPWDTLHDSRRPILDAEIRGARHATFVRLQLRPHAGEPERISASASLARVADALSGILLATGDG
jgi:IclR helix-turn-helix domain